MTGEKAGGAHMLHLPEPFRGGRRGVEWAELIIVFILLLVLVYLAYPNFLS